MFLHNFYSNAVLLDDAVCRSKNEGAIFDRYFPSFWNCDPPKYNAYRNRWRSVQFIFYMFLYLIKPSAAKYLNRKCSLLSQCYNVTCTSAIFFIFFGHLIINLHERNKSMHRLLVKTGLNIQQSASSTTSIKLRNLVRDKPRILSGIFFFGRLLRAKTEGTGTWTSSGKKKKSLIRAFAVRYKNHLAL